MSARDGAGAPVEIGDAQPRSSFRDPTALQVLQVGLIAWVIFGLGVFTFQFSTSMSSTQDLGESLSGALLVATISAVIGLIATLVIGVPSGILLAGSLRDVESPWLHFLAFVGLALLISLTINVLLLGGVSIPAGLFALAPTGSTAVSWCLRWVVFSRSGRVADPSVQEVPTSSTRENG